MLLEIVQWPQVFHGNSFLDPFDEGILGMPQKGSLILRLLSNVFRLSSFLYALDLIFLEFSVGPEVPFFWK